MIDTIHLLYDFTSHKEMEDCIESMKDRYSVDFHYRETSDNSKFPVQQCRCWDDNFKIWLVSNQLHIEGSLTKLYFGNNIQELNGKDVTRAYELFLCKFDIVDWNKAVHKRIDLAINIELSLPPALLTSRLVGAKRMKKSIIKSNSESVIIGNKSQGMIFYDKTFEYKDKKNKNSQLLVVPDNLLRVEYRIMGDYPMRKHFNTDKVTIPVIINNLKVLPQIWYAMYLSIEKSYSNSIQLVSSKKELEMKAIIYFGLEPMKSLIIESYKAKRMSLATKQNMVKYLKDISEYQKRNSDSVDIAKELDEKIDNFMMKNLFHQ